MKKYKKLLIYIKPYWQKVSLNIVFNFLGVIFSVFTITMAIPFLGILFENQPLITEPIPFKLSAQSIQHNFQYVISKILINYGEVQALVIIGAVVLVMSFLKNGFKYLAIYQMAYVRNGLVKDIRNDLYRKALKLPMAYHSKERKGDIISRMTNDVQQVEFSIISSLEMIFRDPITILVYLITLLIISPHLTVVVFVLLPLSGFIIGRIGRNLRATAYRSQSRLGMMLSVLEETLTGIRVIKAFNAENKTTLRFTTLNRFYTLIMTKMHRRQSLASPTSEFLGTLVVILIMWYGGYLVLGAQTGLTSQSFIGYLLIFAQIINPAKSITTAYYNILKGMASADRIQEIFEAKVTIDDHKFSLPIERFEQSIEFRNVSFRYENTDVLKNINLVIPKGKTIALVGQSGAGKSTLVDLIPRFYDACEGQILIDNHNIKDVKIHDLRNLIGNVSQEAILFNDNFFNNIAFGVFNVSLDDVIKAAKIANAHEFIERTPLGYYTNLGDRGNKLSGGQRQRLSIARAILRNPPILILDEATSALDSESEKLVQDALGTVMKNRTSVVIAHRLSTVVNADLICVMHDGRIVEQGTHNELIHKNGIYNKLHNLQAFTE